MSVRRILIVGFTVLPSFLLTQESRACSICGCGDPMLAASDPAAISGVLRLAVETEYLRIDAGTDGEPGYTDQLTQWSYRVNAVYRPIRSLSLMITAPLLDKSIRTVGPGLDRSDSSLVGFGDIEIGARYTAWKTANYGNGRYQEIGFSVGSMIPTGSNDAQTMDATGLSTLVDPHGQLGSGTWGPFVGLHYRFEQAAWLGFADVSYRLRTTGSYSDGSTYKFGNAVLWSVHGQYRPLPELALDLGVDGRYAAADRAVDADGTVTDHVENTGGTVLSAAPGVYFDTVAGLWLFVRGQIPFYKNLYGEQDLKPALVMGLQFQVL